MLVGHCTAREMAQYNVGINSEFRDWEWSADAGERARLLQSPSVETVPKSSEGQEHGTGATSTLGAIFIVVNAALGAGLLNFPAAFSTAGGVAAGITLQMVRGAAWGDMGTSTIDETGSCGRHVRMWSFLPALGPVMVPQPGRDG